MAHRQPPPGRARPSNGSSSRPPETQVEITYNMAVQSFVRRDHGKVQMILSRLLTLLGQQRGSHPGTWYLFDASDNGEDESVEEWIVKSLKLVISSTASLYADPPTSTATLTDETASLLPPSSPDRILSYLLQRCLSHYPTSGDTLLPPQLLSTLLLAALKLRPHQASLDFAHRTSEEWLAALPDSFIQAISIRERSRDKADRQRRRVESAREGYLKVVELFVGEILAREGEWEMARGFLEGEVVMTSRRKEALYRHLRFVQSSTGPQPLPAPSPSSSLVLPQPSPPCEPLSRRQKSRSGSSSSSSSERTARPLAGQAGLTQTAGLTSKGKARDNAESIPALTEAERSLSRVGAESPRTEPVPTKRVTEPTSSASALLNNALALLPRSIRQSLQPFIKHRLAYLALPFPLLLLLLWVLRRRRRAVKPGATLSTLPPGNVKDRLRAVRAQQGGWAEWLSYYLRWWVGKFLGVWKLGTTITYV
ncbi:hypothetical protein IAU60_004360 [Kwoniella sp. DSM 27419]